MILQLAVEVWQRGGPSRRKASRTERGGRLFPTPPRLRARVGPSAVDRGAARSARVSNPRLRRAPPRARGPGSWRRAAAGGRLQGRRRAGSRGGGGGPCGARRRRRRGDIQPGAPQHGAGRAEAGAARRRPRAAAPQRCRGVLEAALGHVLVLRQGGAGTADPRRDPPGHRRHEGLGQELPDRQAGAAHRQGSAEERSGGHGGADVVLHWGDHRQGRPDRVQCLKTHPQQRCLWCCGPKSVTGSVIIKPGSDVELSWSFVAVGV